MRLPHRKSNLAIGTLLLTAVVGLSGCELLGAGSLQAIAPNANIRTVALLESPSAAELAAYYCEDLARGEIIESLAIRACRAFLPRAPRKIDLTFTFDTIFDLENGNNFPVPMVELLLALEVFEGQDAAELAALCVSFCDPEAETCVDAPPEDACKPADKEIRSIEDLVPTIDDLVKVADDAISGRLLDQDNLSFRMIPAAESSGCRPAADFCEARDVDGVDNFCCGSECTPLDSGCRVADEAGQTCIFCPGKAEAHVAFSLGVEAVLKILKKVFVDGYDQIISGSLPSFDIPYTATGTLFFEVPVLGRLGIEFGPLSGLFEPLN